MLVDPPRVGDPQARARDTAPRDGLLRGVLGSTLFVFVIEAVALVALGTLGFDVAVPARGSSRSSSRSSLGGARFAAMGIGLTR